MQRKTAWKNSRRAYTLRVDHEDPRAPVVALDQEGEATIYLTYEEAGQLIKDLGRIVQSKNRRD